MTLPGWVLAIFLTMAAAVPAGVYFTATLFFPPDQSYTYVGQGTAQGAPGPVAGAGLSIAAVAYAAYWIIRRRRKPD
ncbi:hypothetical protein IVA87_26230 [Bradyrhizobium sp. 147]|uniref:hypothetical protein n=1 Tax=unclassified Bradyrhizobium TaxID=2631580 RepID=UPI001FF8A24C|nr:MULTISPECIES: hypothetical protein [unclassified Bradyrhizobium]MCK1597289.1 hypothetical protein [Bradyrhizobium sp. 164]MCK1682815.1 hypothetical protein [Bradyrhizobium sp. 147]MCK1757575.1 hypothetical protein [Bradyrhizobium sp. 137]